MGRATALPIPEAAAGDLALADKMNPMFKKTTLPKAVTAKTQIRFPLTCPSKTNTPRARIIPACTKANKTWAVISAAKNFQIGRGVTSSRFKINRFRNVLIRTAIETMELVMIPSPSSPISTLSKQSTSEA
jgi:hypothetical protein